MAQALDPHLNSVDLMPRFITRVELHAADGDDYARLHAAMQEVHFYRYIADDLGRRYSLPTAEYYSQGDTLTAEAVRDLAIQTAAVTGRTCWVLVSEFNRAAWTLAMQPTRGIA